LEDDVDNDDALEKNQSNQENKPSKEDVPLWLQGLEDLEKIEDTTPLEKPESAKDAWVKEMPEELDDAGKSLMSDEESQLAQSGLPEWLREASEEEPTPLSTKDSSEDIEADAPIQDDTIREESEPQQVGEGFIELESPHLAPDQDIEGPSKPEISPDDEFVEIPMGEMKNQQDQEVYHEIEDNEDLPEWLKEMISEPEESAIEDAEVEMARSAIDDSTAQPAENFDLEIPQETEDRVDEALQTGIGTPELETEAEDEIEKLSEFTPDEETKPIEVQPALQDAADEDSVEAFIEPTEAVEEALTLEYAKYQFEQGNLKQAIEVIASIKDEPNNFEYLDEMEKILLEETKSSAKDYLDAWELLGDISLLKNKPDEAFKAYKEAIQLLLNSEKEKDETD
jgi:tetratricopeptide (TPR) repeat protein